MSSLLNTERPPVYCPGCSHERVVYALDQAFQDMGLAGNQIVIVSDIGCSGLFDTFFHTHVMHGVHGRALTYATGIKMACPDMHGVVIMGDGGMGIGGAHVLSACRRNLNLTLLVLNNFNFGMTGGQFSATTPSEAMTSSGFLNQLEKPLDICNVAVSAGAPYGVRISAFDKQLSKTLRQAIEFDGFSVVDIWEICPGRYLQQNTLTPATIESRIAALPKFDGPVESNLRPEYGTEYRTMVQSGKSSPEPIRIEVQHSPPEIQDHAVIILGSAGQRIITAGEILCIAGISGGFHVTQKNEFNVTVLRGHCISEIILSPEKIDYTGIELPTVIIALSREGIERQKNIFRRLDANTFIVKDEHVSIPECVAHVHSVNFETQRIKSQDWALASLAVLAKLHRVVTMDMLRAAVKLAFKDRILDDSLTLIERVEP